MTETNPLLLLLMRSEKRPPLKTGELLLRTVLGTGKKSHGVGHIVAETGKGYNEVLSDTVEKLKSCRKAIESDPMTYQENALDVIDKMTASAVSALNHE
jgi:hypothetical protein